MYCSIKSDCTIRGYKKQSGLFSWEDYEKLKRYNFLDYRVRGNLLMDNWIM